MSQCMLMHRETETEGGGGGEGGDWLQPSITHVVEF